MQAVPISKALAGKDGVSEEMRARVVALAAEMGYVAPGQSRADTAPGNIGILVADRFFDDSTFYSALYREVLMRCTASTGSRAASTRLEPPAART